MKGFGERNKSNYKSFKDNNNSEEQIINQAIKLHLKGNIPEAAKYYQNCIDKGFRDHRVFSNYGIILNNLGKLKDAEFLYRKAIEINPNYANAHFNLGNLLCDLGKLKDAESSTRRAIKLNSNYANAYSNLGRILCDLGRLKDAEFSYRKAIKLNPNFVDAYYNLGRILCDLGRLKDAESSTRKAIELNPNFTFAHYNLGRILCDLGRLKDAEFSYRKAIQLKPDLAIAHSNLGNLLSDLGNLKDAEISIRNAIKFNPDYAIAHLNLGNVLHNLGNLKDAEFAYRKAIKLKPSFADAYFNLSLVELTKGNYQSGLENYEFRFKTKKPVKTNGQTKLKRLDYEKLKQGDKLLVISEQGLGDTLQYMRYIPHLKNQGLEVAFSAQEKLHPLIKSSGIHENPLTPEQTSTVLEGQWIPLLSLPKYLQARSNNKIITGPYIYSTKELNKKWNTILSKEKRPIIGINWQGNKETEINYLKGRSLPLETFSILARNNNFKFLSLQKGFGSEQLEHCSFKNKFIKCQTQIDSTWDFLENAAIIENCDLIITSDTSIAHLAGGMGKKVWVLLQDIPYWTWGLVGDSTFWYPSMRLFRQSEPGNWHKVMKKVSNTIKKEIEVKV